MKWIPALLCALALSAQAEKATDFIRVDQDEKAARLQTGITTYQKDDVSIALIGAVHIADKAYYGKLNAEFKNYDRLLFEMIGGDKMGQAQKEKAADLSFLGKTYALIAGFLKLSDQKSEIDYRAKNFVHADLTHKEFETLQEQRGESLLSFAMEAGKGAEDPPQLSPERLLKAILTGNANGVKLEIVHALGQGDEQMGGLIGQTVIISDRNKKCFQVLDQQIKNGSKKLGIFYGAAHFPDMEKTLLERGYKKQSHKWLTAWDIPKE